MSTNKYAEMSDEKIIKLEQGAKAIVIFFSVIMLIMTASTLYTTLKKGFSGLSVMPLAFMPIYLLNINSFRQIKKEKKLRNL